MYTQLYKCNFWVYFCVIFHVYIVSGLITFYLATNKWTYLKTANSSDLCPHAHPPNYFTHAHTHTHTRKNCVWTCSSWVCKHTCTWPTAWLESSVAQSMRCRLFYYVLLLVHVHLFWHHLLESLSYLIGLLSYLCQKSVVCFLLHWCMGLSFHTH